MIKILWTGSQLDTQIFTKYLQNILKIFSKYDQTVVNRQPVGYSTNQPLYGILLWGGLGISLGSNFLSPTRNTWWSISDREKNFWSVSDRNGLLRQQGDWDDGIKDQQDDAKVIFKLVSNPIKCSAEWFLRDFVWLSSLFLFSLGFTVVLTASVVVMVCSMAGIPTSTTHCQVQIKIISIIITILNLIVLVIA